jgi:hypothetical protein
MHKRTRLRTFNRRRERRRDKQGDLTNREYRILSNSLAELKAQRQSHERAEREGRVIHVVILRDGPVVYSPRLIEKAKV